MKSGARIQHQQLNPLDLSQESCERQTDQLYRFLYWLVCSGPLHSPEIIDRLDEANSTLHRHILSVAQDLMYIASREKNGKPSGTECYFT